VIVAAASLLGRQRGVIGLGILQNTEEAVVGGRKKDSVSGRMANEEDARMLISFNYVACGFYVLAPQL
jgi:hypothetical protein